MNTLLEFHFKNSNKKFLKQIKHSFNDEIVSTLKRILIFERHDCSECSFIGLSDFFLVF